MIQTVLTLGDVTFDYLEVPEKIRIGATQALVKHNLVGGATVVDSMGGFDSPLEWQGEFRGPEALARARLLLAMCKGGKAYAVAWSGLSYSVVIERFDADFERDYQLPYTITCTVAEDTAAPQAPAAPASVDTLVATDDAQATALGELVGDPTLNGLLGRVTAQLASVQSLVSAPSDVLTACLSPITDSLGQVGALIAESEAVVGSVTTLGGVLPGNPLALTAETLLDQTFHMGRLADLHSLDCVLDRMAINIGAIGASGRNVVAGGGNLYRIAAEEYGDADEWSTIARANGMTDPVLSGIQQLRLPPQPDGLGGVLAT